MRWRGPEVPHARLCRRRGFSLLELVIVAVIIAIIAAIAVPRVGRAMRQAAISTLVADARTLNDALDRYAAEHLGTYPTAELVERQLLLYSNESGTKLSEQLEPASGVLFGPYVREIPPLPLGPNAGSTKIGQKGDADAGWIYLEKSQRIIPNISGTEFGIPAEVFEDPTSVTVRSDG